MIISSRTTSEEDDKIYIEFQASAPKPESGLKIISKNVAMMFHNHVSIV